MKKVVVLAMLVVSVALLGQDAEAIPENPALEMFDADIIFAVSFDDGTAIADLAEGTGEPTRMHKKDLPLTTEKGVFGKAFLANNIIYYEGGKNIDLVLPGSMLMWVCPKDWKCEKGEQTKEPGFQVFHTWAKGIELIVAKMGGQPWGNGHFMPYVQYAGGSDGADTCVLYNTATTAKWPNGEWRMIAVTWGNGCITGSVNGKKSIQKVLRKPMAANPDRFSVGGINGFNLLIDEVIILKRQLRDEEIAKVYEESKKFIK